MGDKSDLKPEPPKDKPDVDDVKEAVEPLKAPGFHVVEGKTYLGTYPTREDAQMFIDGHLTPQGITATIVEGPPAE